MALIACLIVLNLPIYLLVGWILFDDPQEPVESVLGAIGLILVKMFTPSVPSYEAIDPERRQGDLGLWAHKIAFVLGCISITGGEWYVVHDWLLPMFSRF